MVDEIAWIKMTVNRRMAKSHGYYLQHAKEVRAWRHQCAPLCITTSGQQS